jgi:RNA polymerase subunit RPABC4/transcription elongation factor Spt4
MLVGWPGGSWQDTVRLVGIVLGAYGGVLWLSAIVWTYRDIRERTRDSVSQTVAVLLVLLFNVAGLLLYFILRPQQTLTEAYERSLEAEALLQELQEQQACPTCRRRVEPDFIVCPYCRTALRDRCANCGRALKFAWSACPFCGSERARAPAATSPLAERPSVPSTGPTAAPATPEPEPIAAPGTPADASPAAPESEAQASPEETASPPRAARGSRASGPGQHPQGSRVPPKAEPLS